MKVKESLKLFDGYPEEFKKYMNIVKNLKFIDKPDYQSLRNLFINFLKKNK